MRILFFLIVTINLLHAAPPLKVGWAEATPYAYEESGKTLGLDIEIAQRIFKKAGLKATFQKISWFEGDDLLKNGEVDMIIGRSLFDPNLQKELSVSYRTEKIAYFTLKQKDVANPRLGVLQEAVLPALSEISGQVEVQEFETLPELIEALQDEEIDGFVADQVAASAYIWRLGLGDRIAYKTLKTSLPVCLKFSKMLDQKIVGGINQSIQKLKNQEAFQDTIARYIHPIFLSQVIDQTWFFIIDLIGTIAFAVSGVLIAYRERYSLFSAYFLALLPAVGGGTIRDLIVGREPIFFLNNPAYMVSIILTATLGIIIGLALKNRRQFLQKYWQDALQTFDAMGLAAFTVIGVGVAFLKNTEPLWLWAPLLAVLTSIGGGILRDLFRSDHYITALRGEIYPEISLFWGTVLTAYLLLSKETIDFDLAFLAVLFCLAGAFGTRMYCYKKKLHLKLLS